MHKFLKTLTTTCHIMDKEMICEFIWTRIIQNGRYAVLLKYCCIHLFLQKAILWFLLQILCFYFLSAAYFTFLLISPDYRHQTPLNLLQTASVRLHKIITILIQLRDSEIFFYNAICPIWILSFRNTLPLKRNSQHELHKNRHVTDSACGVWACCMEIQETSLLFLFNGMCITDMLAPTDVRHLK